MIGRFLARQPGKIDGLGLQHLKVYQGDTLSLKDPNSLTDEIGDQLKLKHFNKFIDVHVVRDLFDGSKPKEKLLFTFWSLERDSQFHNKMY